MKDKEAVTLWLLTAILLNSTHSTKSRDPAKSKPHIIFILADDVGWNDISWNNPHAINPHLEKLAKEGVILNQSYVQPICSPTRSALMTGRYPYTIGRQHYVIRPRQPTGLTLKRQLLPEIMKKAGYTTHIVGKWHLGFCNWAYVPTNRGFDTFWGYYLGQETYFNHTREYDAVDEKCSRESNFHRSVLFLKRDSDEQAGYDFRNNTKVEYSVQGEYSTYTFASYIEDLLSSRNPDDPMFLYLPFQSVHEPLEVPDNYTKSFGYINDTNRQLKLGMVLAMDEAVGRVIEALKDTGHYDNSIIIFSTDNGASITFAGNNWPLRGDRGSCWEGGTRGPAFVHSPLLKRKGVVSNQLIHVTDWFPTIAGLAGGTAPDDIDGIDQWESISKGTPSPRDKMVYNIDKTGNLSASIRMGHYKLLAGEQEDGSWTYPPEGYNNTADNKQIPEEASEDTHGQTTIEKLGLDLSDFPVLSQFASKNLTVQLYDLLEDPEERKDLSEDRKDIVTSMMDLLQEFLKDYVEPDEQPEVPEGSPKNFNEDPAERKYLSEDRKDIVTSMMDLLQEFLKDYVEPDEHPEVLEGSPANFNGTWSPGWCET